MQRSGTRRSFLGLLIALFVVLTGAGFSASAPISALAATIECAPPSTVTAAPAASSPAVEAPAAPEPVAFPEGGGELTVFAAASLTDSFNEIGAVLQEANPGLTITFNYAGSQALVTQLVEGSPADVVALASPSQMRNAVEQGVIATESVVFVQNKLAIVVPKGNPAGVASMADLGKDGLKLVVAAAEVPVGQFARESVCKAALDTATYGEDFAGAVGANIVSEEDNVKAVLTKVQLGEADAGVVYATDVTAEVAADVELIEVPAEVNVIANYPIAAAEGGNLELAQAFIDFVLGPEGQAILESYGFVPKP